MSDFRIELDGLYEYSNEGKYMIFYKDNKVATRNTRQRANQYVKEMKKKIEKEAPYHKHILENVLILLRNNN